MPGSGAWLLLAARRCSPPPVLERSARAASPPRAPPRGPRATRSHWRGSRFGLAAYLMFGLGYIGYMTFVVTLLREQGFPGRRS